MTSGFPGNLVIKGNTDIYVYGCHGVLDFSKTPVVIASLVLLADGGFLF